MSVAGWLKGKAFPLETLPGRTLDRVVFEARRFRPLPSKVDFVIAGFERCGTTTLDGYLRENPQIGMGLRKEVHFFDRDENFKNGMPSYSKYHRFFDGKRTLAVRGDATPGYLCWPAAPERMRQYNPNLKIILLMREPAARAFSDWNFSRVTGSEPLSFSEAIRSPSEAVRINWPRRKPEMPWYHYIDRGFYAEQIENLWRHFPRSQSLPLRTEDLAADPQAVLRAVCQFLEIDNAAFPEPKHLNARDYEQGMSDEDRTYLEKVYEPHIAALERLLDWDCSAWRR